MGLNIGIIKYDQGKYVQHLDWSVWDGCRHVGDHFFCSNHPEAVYNKEADSEDIEYRPKDFAEWRDFVNQANEEDIPAINKPRLLALLDILEANENLWISPSY